MLLREAHRRVRLDEERRLLALLGPGLAALVERVVDPGRRAPAGVIGHGLDLPVGLPEDLAAVERQRRQLLLELEQMGEVLVRPLLPAGGPDELEMTRQTAQEGAA